MNDLEIENYIRCAYAEYFHRTDKDLLTSSQSTAIVACWSSKSNTWVSDHSHIDLLSCILIALNPEPYKEGYEDLAMATLGHIFDRTLGWIRSFQDGWFGLDNSSNSISGYSMGRRFRLKYLNKDAL